MASVRRKLKSAALLFASMKNAYRIADNERKKRKKQPKWNKCHVMWRFEKLWNRPPQKANLCSFYDWIKVFSIYNILGKLIEVATSLFTVSISVFFFFCLKFVRVLADYHEKFSCFKFRTWCFLCAVCQISCWMNVNHRKSYTHTIFIVVLSKGIRYMLLYLILSFLNQFSIKFIIK